jgi:hypothetical protein
MPVPVRLLFVGFVDTKVTVTVGKDPRRQIVYGKQGGKIFF